ncbi:hypothetical protein B0T14DRAFT_343789 [Immersiella caudata]|uniref:Protein kinase domain-containing protein n=1 Tax=Immersiella caudata TaxID=314043 RepID=A0AA39WBB2_9PEZI|nr:hypothetical protein B0T14DRAFT_343789 [Immersiella caudata]
MDTSGRTSTQRQPGNLRASGLSPIMLTDDPRLHRQPASLEDCIADNEPEGFIPLSDTLLLKASCSKDEADILEYVGKDIATSLISRVGQINVARLTFHQESAIIERGVPFVLLEIRPEERLPASLRIIELVSQLHARGIVHGDVNPSSLRWNSEGQLIFADFANARLVDRGNPDKTQQRCWDGDEEFVSPRARSNTHFGRCFVPTESDDLFAMAVTLWCVWAGRRPESGMFTRNSGQSPDLGVITDPDIFGDIVDILQQGNLNLNPHLPCTPLRGRELSPPFLACHDEVASRSPSPTLQIPSAVSRDNSFEGSCGNPSNPVVKHPVELLADVPFSAALPSTKVHQPALPAVVLARRNSCPPLRIYRLNEWSTEKTCGTQEESCLRESNADPQSRTSLSFTLRISSTVPSPSPQPTEFEFDQDQHGDASSDTSSEDELDEEITWEFPFPFMQGLPCSPTDSMACLASPKVSLPPEFAVRVSPEQLRLQGHRRVQSVGSIMERIQESEGRRGGQEEV